MKTLEYRLVQDRHKKPLVMLESAMGSGQEIYPEDLRRLGSILIKIADESEDRDMGKSYFPARKSTQY